MTAPLVLLHGVGLDRTMWEPFVEQIGTSCIALDLPGHGSRPPLRRPQTLRTLAEDVLARLPEGRVRLVGFSLGALIGQHLARFAPERIASLVCVSSVCRRTPEEAARVEERLRLAEADFPGSAEASIERWYPAGTSVPRDVVDATRATLLSCDVESYLHAYTVFARGDREIGPELEGIRIPVLAITGERDPGSTPEMSRRLGAAIPDCEVRIVPGARHMLPVEDTAALVAAIDEFTTRTAQSEGKRA